MQWHRPYKRNTYRIRSSSKFKGICLHEHKIDYSAPGPSVAAGIGSLLKLIPKSFINLFNKPYILQSQQDNQEKVKYLVGKLLFQHAAN